MRAFLRTLRGCRRPLLAALVIAASGIVALEALPLRAWDYDFLLNARAKLLRRMPPPEVALVHFDAKAQPPPEFYAALVRALFEAGARGMVLDVVLESAQWTESASRPFIQALASCAPGNPWNHREMPVALAVSPEPNLDPWSPSRSVRPLASGLWPFIAAAEARGEVALGVSELLRDRGDHVIRRHSTDSGCVFPPLAAAAAAFINQRHVRLQTNWIHYYGPPGTLSTLNVEWTGDTTGPLHWTGATPLAAVAGRVVFVGHRDPSSAPSTTTDDADLHRTPFSGTTNALASGVEIHATIYANLLRRDWIRQIPRWGEWLLLALSGFVAGSFAARAPFRRAALAAIAGSVVVLLLALALFATTRVVAPWSAIAVFQLLATALVAIVPARTAFISFRYADGLPVAQILARELRRRGVDVFLDAADDASGKLERILLPEIGRRANFLLLLTPGVIRHWKPGADWMERELATARGRAGNIVPILVDDFASWLRGERERNPDGIPEPLESVLQNDKRAEFQSTMPDASADLIARRLRRRIRWSSRPVLLIALLLMWGPALPAQPQSTGRILWVHKDVQVSRRPGVWDVASTKFPSSELSPGDEVRTLDGSEAKVEIRNARDISYARPVHLKPLSRLRMPPAAGPVQLREGLFQFFSRASAEVWQWATETVLGSVKGTDFLVAVDAEGRVLVRVTQGEVELLNRQDPADSLRLQSLEAAEYDPRDGRLRRVPYLDLELQGLAQTLLYYPGVLRLEDLPATALDAQFAEAIEAYKAGDLPAALAAFPSDQSDLIPEARLWRAYLLLAVGGAPDAIRILEDLEAAGALQGNMARLANALRQLIAAVQGASHDHLEPPALPTEWLAESYHLQSLADRQPSSRATEPLERALAAAARATELAPDFGFAWVRQAELQFSLGRASAAEEALSRAGPGAARNAQASALRGFIAASRGKRAQSREHFQEAIRLDPSLANGWLGIGLMDFKENAGDARSRLGRLLPRLRAQADSPGLRELETAAAAEPERSLLRSYLGKAYVDSAGALGGGSARFRRLGLEQLEIARTLDPADPTPYLYSALALRQENRINEAVSNLVASQERNDHRSPFRSSLLLDQDRAVRAANLAGIYADAGLQEVGLSEAASALEADYANPAAHRFLADAYNALRDPRLSDLRHETATISEYLLANLLNPVGAGTLSPLISQQEYARLLERDFLGFVSSASYLSSGDWLVQAAQHGVTGASAYALEGQYQRLKPGETEPGIEERLLSAQFKQGLGERDSVYFQITHDNVDARIPRSGRDAIDARLSETHAPLVAAGHHHVWSPSSRLLTLAGFLDSELRLDAPQSRLHSLVIGRDGTAVDYYGRSRVGADAFDLQLETEFRAAVAEVQHIQSWEDHEIIAGFRAHAGREEADSSQRFQGSLLYAPYFAGTERGAASLHYERLGAYLYDRWRVLRSLELTMGVSLDWIQFSDLAVSPPLIDAPEQSEVRVLPKLGVRWRPIPPVVLRAAYSQAISGFRQEASLRLEPTSVAGVNQAYRSLIPESLAGPLGGTRFEIFGAGVDAQLPAGFFAGAGWERRESSAERRQPYYWGEDEFLGFFPAAIPQDVDYTEDVFSAHIDKLLGRSWSIGARYRHFEHDLRIASDFIEARGWPPGERGSKGRSDAFDARLAFNHSSGFFARFEADWVLGRFSERGASGQRDEAWQFHAYAGCRVAQRRAEVTVGVLNITDQDASPAAFGGFSALPPERALLVRLNLNLR